MIRMENISLTLGDFSIDNISLTVAEGECLVLLGPTGTGKTVLLETIAGIYRPRTGRIWINGLDVTRKRAKERRLGVVYQDYALFPHMTVFDNIAFGLKVSGVRAGDAAARVGRIAASLGISALLHRRPDRLSGGEQQRVAIARALVIEPHALLLDEPLSALDGATRNRLRQELKNIHKKLGVTILHVTHDLADAFFLADRMAILKDGKLLQADNPEKILCRPVSRMAAGLVGINNILEGKADDGFLVTGIGPIRIPAGFDAAPAGTRGWAAIPDWAVHILPDTEKEEYLWTGKMRIVDIDFTESMIRLRFAGENGVQLQTMLSRREAGMLSLDFEIGARVHAGIHEKGVSVNFLS